MTLHINGQPRQFTGVMNLVELLASLELVGKRIAVEKNGEIVPKSQHPTTPISDGDQLEIVVAVGGG
ncbi:MAG: sulfur carrier protein ThiS [Pseudomonadota bacterium]|nr:sulfur carrier protein ThiS [Pseudomonadota bacterium]MDP1902943.1 sulfur carrier protein ThiS [Pseudomonadota bacterium]MDP2353042.1 sulfur carrier protein ThiS [Pseudomonadota bacterium]